MRTRVVVYGADWCRPCQKAKALLDNASVPFIFRDIEQNDDHKKYAMSVQKTIPLVVIENDAGAAAIIGGLDRLKEMEEVLTYLFAVPQAKDIADADRS